MYFQASNHSTDFKIIWAHTNESVLHNALLIKFVINFVFALASLLLSILVKLYHSVVNSVNKPHY